MNFQVPQFIEVENKLIGPLTLKQFLYLAGGAGVSYIIFIINLPLVLRIIPIFVVIVLSLALAFYKINERPFVDVLDSAIKYAVGKKLYLWKQKIETTKSDTPKQKVSTTAYIPKLSESKLNDLAWKLDVKDQEINEDQN